MDLHRSQQEDDVLFQLQWPQLRRLNLHCVFISSLAAILQNAPLLEELTVFGSDRNVVIKTFLHSLPSRLPALEVLRISGSTSIDFSPIEEEEEEEDDHDTTGSDVLFFPNPRKLNIRGCKMVRIPRFFHPPNCPLLQDFYMVGNGTLSVPLQFADSTVNW